MQLNVDPRLPRGEPQLVGLSRFRYDPSRLPVEPHHTTVAQNYSKLQPCLTYTHLEYSHRER